MLIMIIFHRYIERYLWNNIKIPALFARDLRANSAFFRGRNTCIIIILALRWGGGVEGGGQEASREVIMSFFFFFFTFLPSSRLRLVRLYTMTTYLGMSQL